jgi:hypothetical protein
VTQGLNTIRLAPVMSEEEGFRTVRFKVAKATKRISGDNDGKRTSPPHVLMTSCGP